jgi:hypothetical protein
LTRTRSGIESARGAMRLPGAWTNRETEFWTPETKAPEMAREPSIRPRRDCAHAQKAANSGLFAHLQETLPPARLRGGARRTRTGNQMITPITPRYLELFRQKSNIRISDRERLNFLYRKGVTPAFAHLSVSLANRPRTTLRATIIVHACPSKALRSLIDKLSTLCLSVSAVILPPRSEATT